MVKLNLSQAIQELNRLDQEKYPYTWQTANKICRACRNAEIKGARYGTQWSIPMKALTDWAKDN